MADIARPSAELTSLDAAEGRAAVRDRFGKFNGGRFGSLVIAPARLLLYFIIVFPFTIILYLSFTQYSPITAGGLNWWHANRWWNWGANYAEIVTNMQFINAVTRTLLIVIVAVTAELLIGLGLALLFVEKLRFKALFQTLYLIPMMVVPAVAGYMWFMLLQGNGPVNGILSILTGQNVAIPWLTDPTIAIISVIVADIWQWTPLMFLILLSGLVALPEDQMRAATMLGASWWQKFRWLTLPMLRPVIIIALIIRSMEALKLFDLPFLMTRGGPAQATETISIFLYKLGFQNFRWALVAAAAVVILIAITVLANYALRPLQTSAEQVSQIQEEGAE
ncbi:MAG: sugar ABC transporter permease [Aggregatilineales bacterium]